MTLTLVTSFHNFLGILSHGRQIVSSLKGFLCESSTSKVLATNTLMYLGKDIITFVTFPSMIEQVEVLVLP